MSSAILRRLDKIIAARRGARGRKIVTFDDWGDAQANDAHAAHVRQLEAQGFDVLNIVRCHSLEAIDKDPRTTTIQRSYGAGALAG